MSAFLGHLRMSVVLWLAATLVASPVPASAETPAAPVRKPQAVVLAPDPALRVGKLANGMRYMIMHNATPPKQASLRLRFGAGSLNETDTQQGLAHFLEHMAFKGSTKVPGDEMVRILERKGLAFGPDTNAATSYEDTTYMLDLPEVDADTIGTGLMLMRQTASELTLDAKAFDGERGVILSEERARDTPASRAQTALINLLLEGQLAARRRPIGKTEIIRDAPVQRIRDFYRTWYRPDNATLVAVGDFDVAGMEARIKAEFSNWKAAAPEGPAPVLGKVKQRGLTVRVVDVPGAATQVRLAYVHPYKDDGDTLATRRRDIVDELAIAVLSRRLDTLARRNDAPFINAGAGYDDLVKSAKVAVIIAESSPVGWRGALGAIVAEQRRLVRYGVSQDELDREIIERRAVYQTLVGRAGTRRTPDLARQVLATVSPQTVFTAPKTDLAIFEASVRNLTAAEVSKAAASMFSGSGPLIQLSTPTAISDGEATVRSVYEAAAAKPVEAPATNAKVVWPYTDFGKPGAVTARHTIDGLDLVSVTYSNGVRLLLKKTAFRKDEIAVSVNAGYGRLALPLDKPSDIWTTLGLVAGGLKKINQEDMEKALAGVVTSVNFEVTDSAFRFSGNTRPEDLATQLQVLAAYVSDAGYRPEAFARTREATLAYLPQLDAVPDGVLYTEMPFLLHGRDVRWRFPSRSQIEAATPETLSGLMTPLLARGPLDIAIVGDIDIERTVALVGQIFGALPKRDASAPPPAALDVSFLKDRPDQPMTLTHEGRADQALALVAWPVGGLFPDSFHGRVVYILSDILNSRLRDQIRIAEGATYSPTAEVELSTVFPGYGYAINYVETPPDKLAKVFEHVDRILADMKANGVSEDELARAKTPRLERLRKSFENNNFWLTYMTLANRDERIYELLRNSIASYERISAKDIKDAAAMLAATRPLKVVVKQGAVAHDVSASP